MNNSLQDSGRPANPVGARQCGHRRVAALAAAVLFGQVTAASAAPRHQAEKLQSSERHVYHYRMKGKVRLLLFWVGKDDVGGGHISLERTPDESGGWTEEVSVLFGSNPERVPGRVNRWGYGREQSQWRSSEEGRAWLTASLFEGFMRHSSEEKLSEVRKNAGRDQAAGTFVYDGIRSRVGAREAASEIRVFSPGGDFDYRNPDPVFCGYQERLGEGPPDRSRKLDRQTGDYDSPWGLLTALRQATLTILRKRETDADWKSRRPVSNYVYNARPYELAVTGIGLERDFKLPLEGGRSRTFHQVVKVDFKVGRLSDSDRHSFSLWLPTSGEFRGVPIRIEDKPRWWLRIELNLIPERTESGPGVSRNDSVPCLTANKDLAERVEFECCSKRQDSFFTLTGRTTPARHRGAGGSTGKAATESSQQARSLRRP